MTTYLYLLYWSKLVIMWPASTMSVLLTSLYICKCDVIVDVRWRAPGSGQGTICDRSCELHCDQLGRFDGMRRTHCVDGCATTYGRVSFDLCVIPASTRSFAMKPKQFASCNNRSKHDSDCVCWNVCHVIISFQLFYTIFCIEIVQYQKLVVRRCHYKVRKYSLCIRIINVWNSLPDEIISATSA